MTGWTSLGMTALVALLTIVAFLPTLRNDFVAWDDDRNFLTNPMYRGFNAANLHWMWTTFKEGHYVPLSWMTLGLDYTLWGMDARGYHLTNLLLHVVNAVLLYWIAVRLIRACSGGRSFEMAAAVAVVWYAVHPLRVESVAWATERRDVLSAVFVAASLLCYRPWVVCRRPWGTAYIFSLIFFVCALLSKATALTLPAVLLLLNVYPYRRLRSSPRAVLRELAPFAILSLATIPLTIVALAPGKQLALGAKIAVSAYSLVFYLWKTVLPIGLSPLYPMPKHVDPFELRFILSYVFVLVCAIAAWRARRNYPGVTLAAFAFMVVITPMLGIVQNGPQIAADRYTYHASPALAILVGGALVPLFDGRWSRITTAISALAIVTLMTLTWRQTEVWHDTETFWTYVLEQQPSSDLAHTMVGNFDLQHGRYESAVANYQFSIAADSSFVDSHDNLGIALSHLGQFDEAAPQFRAALRINPNNRETHNNLGIADTHLGNFPEALSEFEKALAIDPRYADAETNWGNALVQMGRAADAIPHYAAASRLQPTSADAHLNWGVALARLNKLPEAITQFRAALEIDPRNAQAADYLAKAEAMLRR